MATLRTRARMVRTPALRTALPASCGKRFRVEDSAVWNLEQDPPWALLPGGNPQKGKVERQPPLPNQ